MPYRDIIGKSVVLTAWQIRKIDPGIHHCIAVMLQDYTDDLVNDIYNIY